MKFETILRAYRKSTIMNILVFLMDSKRTSKFSDWLLRHEEKQAAEIARLQAQVATLTDFIHANIETFEDGE
jgi:hypothetical protein